MNSQNFDGRTVFVTGFAPDVTHSMLSSHFERHAFVEFETTEQAEQARKEANGSMIGEFGLSVYIARPQYDPRANQPRDRGPGSFQPRAQGHPSPFRGPPQHQYQQRAPYQSHSSSGSRGGGQYDEGGSGDGAPRHRHWGDNQNNRYSSSDGDMRRRSGHYNSSGYYQQNRGGPYSYQSRRDDGGYRQQNHHSYGQSQYGGGGGRYDHRSGGGQYDGGNRNYNSRGGGYYNRERWQQRHGHDDSRPYQGGGDRGSRFGYDGSSNGGFRGRWNNSQPGGFNNRGGDRHGFRGRDDGYGFRAKGRSRDFDSERRGPGGASGGAGGWGSSHPQDGDAPKAGGNGQWDVSGAGGWDADPARPQSPANNGRTGPGDKPFDSEAPSERDDAFAAGRRRSGDRSLSRGSYRRSPGRFSRSRSPGPSGHRHGDDERDKSNGYASHPFAGQGSDRFLDNGDGLALSPEQH
ncbi:hypothetical protein GGI12_000756 [Dipsacomyces acuminosporus]|nr:hypothetical protein GGI12_000756 [Dipsacomyces acuminosporus]